MPEDNLEKEIREIAEEAAKNNQPKVEFPDVQKVDVQNWPEQKEPVVNVNVPDVVVPPIKVPRPKVNVETKPPIVNVETNLDALIEAVRESKVEVTPTDLSPLIEKLNELTKTVKEKPVGRSGGAIGPSKYSILNTSGQAIDPATSTDTLKAKDVYGNTKDILAVGPNLKKLATEESNSFLLKEVLTELKIINMHLEVLSDSHFDEDNVEE